MLFGSFTSLPVPSAEKISKRKIFKSKYYVNQLRIQLNVNISRRLQFSHIILNRKNLKTLLAKFSWLLLFTCSNNKFVCYKIFWETRKRNVVFLNVFKANNVFCFLFNKSAVKLYPVFKYDTNEFIRIVLDIYNLFDS